MAIFNPIDVMGPAHRGAQIQQLAQNAAQNVMRRQKMRSLIAQGARGAAQAGAGQPINSSARMHPTSLRGLTLAGAGMAAPGAQGGRGVGPSDGSLGAGGGGYDYPSLPSPADPMQSAHSLMPDAVAATPPPVAPVDPTQQTQQTGVTPTNTTALPPSPTPTTQSGDSTPYGIQGDFGIGRTAGAPIHLGGGLYYDPATDTVTGGGNVHTAGSQY